MYELTAIFSRCSGPQADDDIVRDWTLLLKSLLFLGALCGLIVSSDLLAIFKVRE